MPDWEKATIYDSGRIEVNPSGDDYVRFLAPQFRQNDGADYGIIGFGVDFIGESSADLPPGETPEAQFNNALNSQLIAVLLEDF